MWQSFRLIRGIVRNRLDRVSQIELSGPLAESTVVHLPRLVVLKYPVFARVESVARLCTHRILLTHVNECALEANRPLQFRVQG